MKWFALALALGLGVGLFVWTQTKPDPIVMAVAQQGCVSCHDLEREGPGGLHNLLAKCEGCHLGDPGATNKNTAHLGLELEPGALDTAHQTCGRGGCHPEHLKRIQSSLMSTVSGLISVNKWAFGELEVPTSTQTVLDTLAKQAPTPAEDHARKLCLGCHLNTRKDNRDDMLAGTSSGCSACHLAPKAGPDAPHPAVDRAPPDQRCFGCHSRSGRISLSYQGWAEVRGPELKACDNPITLLDNRLVCQTTEDVHHAAGIACVDCHLHTELMGDGTRYEHEEVQVELQCESCHGPGENLETTWGAVQDPTSRRLLVLNEVTTTATTAVRTGRRGTPLWNLEKRGEEWWLKSKLGARDRRAKATPQDSQHSLPGHERLTCTTCHAAWAPRCPTCHTEYDPEGEQWDFGKSKVVKGQWKEHAERYFADLPTLAQRGDKIVVAAPGMLSTLDARQAGGPRQQTRWFAAFDPHTTVREGRSCASCHLNPVALGLGQGILKLSPRPRFIPADGGPTNGPNSDGWQGLMPQEPSPGTRPEVRGLDATSQWRLLRVGACLGCHTESGDPLFGAFPKNLRRLGANKISTCTGWYRPWMQTLPLSATHH